jgi:uncharacterized metal-binding protein
MKFIILYLLFFILFIALSIVVTASGLGVLSFWLEANTDLSSVSITAINLGLWAAYFLSFVGGIKISGGHL